MLEVALVGTGGMMPLPQRFLSSMICRTGGSMILFDCGEGTQVSLRMLGWGFKQIDTICFTHFHGDHISGLPGILLTMAHSDRTEEIEIIGPAGLETVVNCLCIIAGNLPFPIKFTEIPSRKEAEYPRELFKIKAIPLNHRIQCVGYSLELSRRGKFDPEKAKAQNIPLRVWGPLQRQNEETLVYEGKTYSKSMVLGPPRRGLKLVYCTDTRPVPAMTEFAKEADLFICEGMYGDESKLEKTVASKHMLFREAAEIAKKADVKELWLTHFSPALPDPKNYLSSASDIFPNTVIGKDRMTKVLRYSDSEEQD